MPKNTQNAILSPWNEDTAPLALELFSKGGIEDSDEKIKFCEAFCEWVKNHESADDVCFIDLGCAHLYSNECKNYILVIPENCKNAYKKILDKIGKGVSLAYSEEFTNGLFEGDVIPKYYYYTLENGDEGKTCPPRRPRQKFTCSVNQFYKTKTANQSDRSATPVDVKADGCKQIYQKYSSKLTDRSGKPLSHLYFIPLCPVTEQSVKIPLGQLFIGFSGNDEIKQHKLIRDICLFVFYYYSSLATAKITVDKNRQMERLIADLMGATMDVDTFARLFALGFNAFDDMKHFRENFGFISYFFDPCQNSPRRETASYKGMSFVLVPEDQADDANDPETKYLYSNYLTVENDKDSNFFKKYKQDQPAEPLDKPDTAARKRNKTGKAKSVKSDKKPDAAAQERNKTDEAESVKPSDKPDTAACMDELSKSWNAWTAEHASQGPYPEGDFRNILFYSIDESNEEKQESVCARRYKDSFAEIIDRFSITQSIRNASDVSRNGQWTLCAGDGYAVFSFENEDAEDDEGRIRYNVYRIISGNCAVIAFCRCKNSSVLPPSVIVTVGMKKGLDEKEFPAIVNGLWKHQLIYLSRSIKKQQQKVMPIDALKRQFEEILALRDQDPKMNYAHPGDKIPLSKVKSFFADCTAIIPPSFFENENNTNDFKALSGPYKDGEKWKFAGCIAYSADTAYTIHLSILRSFIENFQPYIERFEIDDIKSGIGDRIVFLPCYHGYMFLCALLRFFLAINGDCGESRHRPISKDGKIHVGFVHDNEHIVSIKLSGLASAEGLCTKASRGAGCSLRREELRCCGGSNIPCVSFSYDDKGDFFISWYSHQIIPVSPAGNGGNGSSPDNEKRGFEALMASMQNRKQ